MLGLHYPSDNVFSLQISAAIVKDKNFRSKYFSYKTIEEEVKKPIPEQQQQPQQEIFGGDVGALETPT